MTMLQVSIDNSRCQGHQMCVLGRPDVFAVGDGDEGHSQVTAPLRADGELASLAQVVAGCPEGAISVTEI